METGSRGACPQKNVLRPNPIERRKTSERYPYQLYISNSIKVERTYHDFGTAYQTNQSELLTSCPLKLVQIILNDRQLCKVNGISSNL